MQRPARAEQLDRLRKGTRSPTPGVRDVVFVYDAGPQRDVGNVRLHGSWNKQTGRYSAEWGTETVPMRYVGNGRWTATVRVVDDGNQHPWEWGVFADVPGRKATWVVHGGKNLTFDPKVGTAAYAPTTYHAMGARRAPNGDLTFKFWDPLASSVVARITAPGGAVTRVPLTLYGEDWVASVRGGFDRHKGSSYAYELIDSAGKARVVSDPYALAVTGEQLGLSRSWFDPTTGAEIHQYITPQTPFMRFELRDDGGSASARVVLKDQGGRELTKAELQARLGPLDVSLRTAIAAGRGIDDLTSVGEDGSLAMRFTDGTWTTLVHNPKALEGLRYEFRLSSGERSTDPWSDRITADSGVSFRESMIVESVRPSTRGTTPPTPWNKAVLYQIHVGSFFSSANNSRRSTFADVCGKLDYLQWLGINAIELLPVTEEQGVRGWGYGMGVVNFATESGLGFVHGGKWVSGREALAMLRTAMRERKMNLVADVVYNHALDGTSPLKVPNPLAEIDPANPYYNWGTRESPMLRKTPWGPMPAFNNPRVRQFLIDHAVAQVLEHGFDGIRFDFTQPIYNEGGEDGRAFLRELVSQLREVAPEALLIPEDFSYQPWIVELMGSLWYTEFQHRLVHDNNPDRPGLVQAAALGKRTDVDAFLKLLTNPIGLKSLAQAITMISNHDEVGNADRTVVVAMGGAKGPPSQWARDVSRLTMMTGLMSPGIPFFFQGDESLATNGFRWGKPSTWDLGWSWLTGKGGDPAVDGPRKAASLFTRDAIALRARSDDLTADVPAKPLYSHNDDSVFAFTRGTDDAKHVVIGNVSKVDRPGYRILLPPGRWREVLNSDAVRYGGRGMTNADAVFEGEARIDLAAGGSLVLERVA